MAYRDSCANLLIPLNRCRAETYYLPWKCSVRRPSFPVPPSSTAAAAAAAGEGRAWSTPGGKNADHRGTFPGRAPFVRKVPVRRVQEARCQDERAARGQGGRPQQLEHMARDRQCAADRGRGAWFATQDERATCLPGAAADGGEVETPTGPFVHRGWSGSRTDSASPKQDP